MINIKYIHRYIEHFPLEIHKGASKIIINGSCQNRSQTA